MRCGFSNTSHPYVVRHHRWTPGMDNKGCQVTTVPSWVSSGWMSTKAGAIGELMALLPSSCKSVTVEVKRDPVSMQRAQEENPTLPTRHLHAYSFLHAGWPREAENSPPGPEHLPFCFASSTSQFHPSLACLSTLEYVTGIWKLLVTSSDFQT